MFFIANKLIQYLVMPLYFLILYLFIINCNTINLYRVIGEAIQQVVGIRLYKYHCIHKTFPKNLIHNLCGYRMDSYIIHDGERKMEENDTDVNSIIKFMHNQLFGILIDSYGVLTNINLWQFMHG